MDYGEKYKHLLDTLKADISKDNAMPLYLQLHKSISKAIEQGIINPGDFLPTERAFIDALNLSRITVRKAFLGLTHDNVVFRARGFGTQVKQPFSYSLSKINGFSEEVNHQNRVPGSIWLERKIASPPPMVAEKLKITENEDVYRFERIRTIDGQPASYTTSYIVTSAVNDINDIGSSLYEYMHQQKIQFGKLSSQVRASLADTDLCEKLRIPDPSAILMVQQLLYDKEQQPLEYSVSYCRGDLYEYLADS